MNLSSLGHQIAAYLKDGNSAVSAILSNHPYPARNLLITLALLVGVAGVVVKIVKATSAK